MQKVNDMTKKLIMILGLVLSSMLMKAQAFFCAFPEGWRQGHLRVREHR